MIVHGFCSGLILCQLCIPLPLWFQSKFISCDEEGRTSIRFQSINKMTNFSILRGSHISFSCFSCGSSIQDELEFKNVAFSAESGNTEVPRKNPSDQCKLPSDSTPGSGDSHIKGRGEILTRSPKRYHGRGVNFFHPKAKEVPIADLHVVVI